MIERDRAASWTNTDELLATLIDTLNAFRAEMAVGIPVVMQKKLKRPSETKPIERPEWVGDTQDADVIVMRPRDLAKKMMGKAS